MSKRYKSRTTRLVNRLPFRGCYPDGRGRVFRIYGGTRFVRRALIGRIKTVKRIGRSPRLVPVNSGLQHSAFGTWNNNNNIVVYVFAVITVTCLQYDARVVCRLRAIRSVSHERVQYATFCRFFISKCIRRQFMASMRIAYDTQEIRLTDLAKLFP